MSVPSHVATPRVVLIVAVALVLQALLLHGWSSLSSVSACVRQAFTTAAETFWVWMSGDPSSCPTRAHELADSVDWFFLFF